MATMIEIGYRPLPADPDAPDKKALFNGFAKHRYYLRRIRRQLGWTNSLLTERRKAEQEGRQCGDFLYTREAQREVEEIEAFVTRQQNAIESVVNTLLDHAYWIDRIATLDEKAALLGLSTKAAQRALASYAERGQAKGESFTMLLAHMPESHADPDIEWPVFAAMMDAVQNHPIAHRRVTQRLNEVFGQELFPLPEVPKPTLVSSREPSPQP